MSTRWHLVRCAHSAFAPFSDIALFLKYICVLGENLIFLLMGCTGKNMAYKIEFARSVGEHFRYLSANERAVLLDAIEEQLAHEPLKETRNRKVLRPNPLSPWELRVGDLRVFYEPGIGIDGSNIIKILAVGRKEGNRLIIGGKVVEL